MTQIEKGKYYQKEDVARYCAVKLYGLSHDVNIIPLIDRQMILYALDLDDDNNNNLLTTVDRDNLLSQITRPNKCN